LLHRYSEVFRSVLMIGDMVLVAACWAAAYALRFYVFWDEPSGPGSPASAVRQPILGILPLVFWTFRSRGLYRPQRTASLLREAGLIVGGMTMAVVLVLAADAALRAWHSRFVIGAFWGLGSATLVASRVTGRGLLRALRRRGYNLRYVLVVGAGDLAAEVIASIHGQPEAGLRILGCLSDDPARQKTIEGARSARRRRGRSCSGGRWTGRDHPRETAASSRRSSPISTTSRHGAPDSDLLHVMTAQLGRARRAAAHQPAREPDGGWAAVQKRARRGRGLLGLVVWRPSSRWRRSPSGRASGGPSSTARRYLTAACSGCLLRTMRTDARRDRARLDSRDGPPDARRGLARRTSVDELPRSGTSCAAT
jgi:hypothetical protein